MADNRSDYHLICRVLYASIHPMLLSTGFFSPAPLHQRRTAFTWADRSNWGIAGEGYSTVEEQGRGVTAASFLLTFYDVCIHYSR